MPARLPIAVRVPQAATKQPASPARRSRRKPPAATKTVPRPPSVKTRPWDFRDLEGVDRSATLATRQVADGFTHILANRLAPWVRVRVTSNVVSVAQTEWTEFVESVSTPGLLCSVPVALGAVFIHLPAPLCMSLLDLHLSGTGSGELPSRPLTDIERQVLSPMVGSLAEGLVDALSGVFGHVDTGPMTLVQGAGNLMQTGQKGSCMLSRVSAALSGVHAPPGQIDVCFPLDALRPLLAKQSETAKPSPSATLAAEEATSRVPLHLTLRYPPVSIPLPVAENLQVGQVLALGHPIGEPLTLCAGGKELFSARPVEHNRRAACQVIGVAGEDSDAGGPP